MQRTRVKICGIGDPETAAHACDRGTDAIGLVFYPGSPRHVEPERAASIVAAVTPFVSTVALFMDPTRDWVQRVLNVIRPDYLQFHGAESPGFCGQFGVPYLKAIPMGDLPDTGEFAGHYPGAAGFLLDSNVAGEAGGSGRAFDWRTGCASLGRPMILAGGLTPANVGEAIRQMDPYGVDVSSGVEASRGVKDKTLISRFLEQVRDADSTRTDEQS